MNRQLDSYPETGARMFYLAITVLATITLYYELYVGGSVATLLLTNLHMSFTFYVITLAFGALIGAFGSLFAGLTDRSGQWRTWYWICFGGIIFFLLSIPLLRGRWRTRDARRDEAEHEAKVQEELAKLTASV